MVATEYNIRLRRPHPRQFSFITSKAKRKVIRAGRRSGKTTGIAILAIEYFLRGERVLYAAPTQDQVESFWWEVKQGLAEALDGGVFYKNESLHIIELTGTKQRIKAKTAWNADSLRGDFCGLLILDEWQLCSEDMWNLVGAPMLADNDGDAVFIYTPPSLHSTSVSKAKDPQHAAKMFKAAKEKEQAAIRLGTEPRWATFHFSSRDNPHISADAINELAEDMTALAYRMEIEAEDVDEAPGALWTRETIQRNRVDKLPEPCHRIVVAIDPSASSTGDEAGIITAGRIAKQGYLLADNSVQGSPKTWATAAVNAYHEHSADCIVAEKNNGGEMITEVIATVDPHIRVVLVHASRGKQTRAEPIAAVYEHDRAHHVGPDGKFALLEDEMCLWTPGDPSPNRMDALVWAFTELGLTAKRVRVFNW